MTELDWKEYTPAADGQAPDDWDGGVVEFWVNGVWRVAASNPYWYSNTKYRYRPKAFDWSQFNAVRDAKGKIVPAEFVGEDGEYAKFRPLGPYSSSACYWQGRELRHFAKDGTNSAGLTLIHHDFDEKPQPSPELVERMVDLCRDLDKVQFCNAHQEQAKARAILAELEPVDPDVEIANAAVEDNLKPDGSQKYDSAFGYACALAAIKRVREGG